MARMSIDEEGLLEEPCLSCDNAYVEDIWHEWCCDKKECSYKPLCWINGIKNPFVWAAESEERNDFR